ncbi:PKD domain-containing protein [Spirosoma rhododendri]|uniref:PKD domain-containing protein n=1 Tax=Spirosoma rhododendri TaxID=2728024 RepID=A0A7L5DQB7_9BACT|nr:PKD domain-containing protein [Spirosoma rhododendri]QJD80619.1 PKD domain-containing protein [Spirosoma rhododendri]
MRQHRLLHPARLLIFGLLLLTACQPFDLDRKVFPTCTKPTATIGVTTDGLDVLFYLESPQGDIGAAGWDPGDGSGSNRVGTRVAYSYARAGTYTVRLTIVNTCDDTFTSTRQITVR